MSCIYGRYKNLILFDYFNKEIKFAIVWLVHRRSPRVLHHVCLQPQSYTFWRLQQVNQFNWELPPPPPNRPTPQNVYYIN